MLLLDHEGLRKKGIKYSKPHMWRLVKGGMFPAPIKLGENKNVWIETEIDKWLESCVAARDRKRPAPISNPVQPNGEKP